MKTKLKSLSLLAILMLLASLPDSLRVTQAAKAVSLDPLQSQPRRRAPELSGGRGWLNTDKPLSLAALKGKIVLLDFWTYGCINCLHIIPDLAALEKKYEKQLVIIGVHSGKYDNEKDTENIRRVILRYQINHPVYNDADFAVWRAYNVNAWPTRVLIDPAGYIVGYVPGEGNYDPLDQAINRTAADFRSRGELNEQPLKLALERAQVADLPLAFPGKVLADAATDRLFIADSSHNRIVITKLDGTLVETIGSGKTGAGDGSFREAAFAKPQGMARAGDFLYVADTDNHLIRRIDLKARRVETIAGTGRQARPLSSGGPARSTDLNSPWDLYLSERSLYVAMAGPHQIWKLDLDGSVIEIFAGAGREGRRDGSLLEARFSQPSGITGDGQIIYAADSEANVIREIDPGKRQVRTLVGANLFEFGDQDGYADEVRLQHPLAVLSFGNKVLIADTYNHRIKELDPRKRTVRSWLGNGKPGQKDGTAPTFFEPSGLSIANARLYVADTNNHAIRVVDLATKQTSTLRIDGLQAPDATTPADTDDFPTTITDQVEVAPQRLRAGADGSLLINVELPPGYHLNPAAPQRYRIGFVEPTTAFDLDPHLSTGSTKELRLPIRVPLRTPRIGQAKLVILLTLFYCREDNTGTCRVKTLMLRAPVEVVSAADSPQEIGVRAKVEIK